MWVGRSGVCETFVGTTIHDTCCTQVELKAKDKHGNVVPYHPHGKHWVDGTIAFDLPMQRLSELFNINQASRAGDTNFFCFG